MNRRWQLLPVAAVLAGGLVACGSGSGSGSGSSNSSAKAPSILNIAVGQAPTGFDPFNNLELPVEQIVQLYGAQLMGLTATGDSGVPQLAKSLTESADRMSWTATLRPGLKFSDGTPLTAADVVASFNYAKTSSGPTGKFVLYDTLSSVVAANPTTVVFKVKKPTSLIPYLLADPGSSIWPASGLAKGKSFFTQPISAGQYKIDSFDKVSGRVVLSRNPNYWGTQPKVTQIVYTVVPNDSTRLAQLKSGTVDVAENFAPTLRSQLTGSVHELTTLAPGTMNWLVFSDDSPITGNKNVRQAINLAIDRQQILQVATSGLGSTLNGIPWTQPELLKSQTPITQDVAKAKQLLQGTPCQNGCTVKVVQPVSANAPTSQIALVMQQQLKAIGVNLQIMNTPAAQVVSAIKSPNVDAYDSGAALGNPAPITVALEEVDPAADIFSSYALTYRSDAMHALVQQLVTAPQSEVNGIVAQINAQFAKDLPYLPLIQTPTLYGSRLPTSVVSVGLDSRLTVG